MAALFLVFSVWCGALPTRDYHAHAASYSWENRTPAETIKPSARHGHAMAFDSARASTVLFGGFGNSSHSGDTWVWDGSIWTKRSPASSPSPRHGHSMVYDTRRQKVVLFGGNNLQGALGDTWEWDGTDWSRKTPAHSPLARSTSMAYDSARGTVVLFGGSGHFVSHLNDTWEWDGADWRQLSPTTKPPGRGGHGMAYDNTRDKVILFGGVSGRNICNDTWEWDGSNWTQAAPVTVPKPRFDGLLTYDSARNKVILFGGGGGNFTQFNDTWEWDGNNWTQRPSVSRPLGRLEHAGVFDSVRGKVVFFGGASYDTSELGDTWEWNGSNWTELAQPSSPPARHVHSMIFDNARSVSVLFGGYSQDVSFRNDTWEWDGNKWMRKSPVSSPSARYFQAMAYDSSRKKTVLFGGYSQSDAHVNDTWEWDGIKWAKKAPSVSPGRRSGHTMAYDSARGRVILFGGYSPTDYYYLSDTWEWDGNNWIQKSPATLPGSLYNPVMAYDSVRAKTVLFGSNGRTGEPGETWEWDGSNWAQKTPAISPPALSTATLTYNMARRRTILFGSYNNGSGYLDQTWEWDGNSWTQRIPLNPPPPRFNHAMTYDSTRSKMVLFSGAAGQPLLNDTWEWDGTAPVSLTVATPAPTSVVKVLTSASGIVTDSTLDKGIGRVDINLRRLSDQKYWSGSAWTIAPTSLHTVIKGNGWSRSNSLPVAGPNPDTQLLEGKYTLVATVYDLAGRSQAIARSTFSVDQSVPTSVTISTPLNQSYVKNLTLLTGTAGDNIGGSGIGRVELSLRRASDLKYWSGYRWYITRQSFEATVGASVWSNSNELPYAGTDIDTQLLDGKYTLTATAYDKAGNRNASSALSSFTVDRTVPAAATIMAPAHRSSIKSLTALAGIATDNPGGTGINKVEITLRRVSDLRYWSGTAWVSTAVQLPGALGSAGWTKTTGLPLAGTDPNTQLLEGAYTLTANIYDKAGNTLAAAPCSFTVDRTPPAALITSPPDGAVMSTFTKIAGTAFDAVSGVAAVNFTLRRSSDNSYWSGSAWTATVVTLNPQVKPTVSGNYFWYYETSTLPMPKGTDLLDGSYVVQARAVDFAGLISPAVVSRFKLRRTSTGASTAEGPSGAEKPSIAPGTSNLQLSSVSATEDGRVRLVFTGALSAASSTDSTRFSATRDGTSIQVLAVQADGQSAILLSFEDGALRVKDRLHITYDLQDAVGRPLRGAALVIVR